MKHMTKSELAREAAWWQKMSSDDYHHQMKFRQHDPVRAVWQEYSAQASARAREYLFELIERGNKS